jgi:hypothetical protein
MSSPLAGEERFLVAVGKRTALAQFTVAYNVIEGMVAVTVGLLAGLVSVIGFGFDRSRRRHSAGQPARCACAPDRQGPPR